MKRGFTLIEILITLLVLVIGLTGSLALVMGSTRAANKAADRNVASIILDEAIADIQRTHLITVPTNSTFPVALTSYNAKYVQANEVGLYIETFDSDNSGQWPNIQNHTGGTTRGDYTGVGTQSGSLKLSNYALPTLFPSPTDPTKSNVVLWPSGPTAKFYGGQLKSAFPPTSTGFAYRVAYKLERHPNWIARAQFSFDGVYVLTLTVYKDLNPDVLPQAPTKQLEQVSDPMVVYLHAKGSTD